MSEKEIEARKQIIIKKLKIRLSQRPLLKNINVVVYSRTETYWYTIIEFEYKNKKYAYREDASCDWIEDENGKEIA